MEYQIKAYSDIYWSQLVELINKYWKENHPIINKSLFNWQYEGFGSKKGIQNTKLLFIDNKLVGFRGVIPGVYQLPKIKSQKEENEYVNGGSFAMWLVHPDYRGKGFGWELLKEVSKENQVLISVGSNVKTSAPIYLRNGFSYLESLNRYVIPLETEGYTNLLSEEVESSLIEQWIKSIKCYQSDITPFKPEPLSMAILWTLSNERVNLFSLHRNQEFWEWRYMRSPGFKYIFFGNYEYPGVIVARFEKVYSPENMATHNTNVMRIIEIIPSDSQVWEGRNIQGISELLGSVLNWAKKNGCCGADFQCSNRRLEKLLFNVGFKKQTSDYGPGICSLAGLFQPLVYKPAPINALWRINDLSGKTLKVGAEDTYIVKSDNDMDRPNIWPVLD